ncbi:MAG: hypothetical protein ABI210_02740 [Abditibacteriaceae bacterium]
MKHWRKDLLKAIDLTQIVELDRTPEIKDRLEGYVVGMSELFLMLHLVDPEYINLNGYVVLRMDDIRRYRVRDDKDFFLNRAFKLKGVNSVPQPEIDLSSFPSLLSTANLAYPLINIQREIMDPDICFIGQLEKMTDKTVTLKEIDPAARWERIRRYRFEDITRIQFGGGYEESLALVAAYESKSVRPNRI